MNKKNQHLNISDLKPLNPNLQKTFDRLVTKLVESHLIGSTLIEGSTFTEVEAKSVIDGKSIYGHVLDEHLELLNGKECASYIHRLFFQKETISELMLDQAHAVLFKDINKNNNTPGVNRSKSGLSAFTLILEKGKPIKHEYEHPKILLKDYPPFINYHINRPLPGDMKNICQRLAEMYFHFQMLHPYSDGNGRIGRFLISAKAASETGLFFRFELADGPLHLDIMMEMTTQYSKDKRSVSYSRLQSFISEHLEEF